MTNDQAPMTDTETGLELRVQSPRIIPPAITDPVARAKAIEELVARMKANPLPANAPKLTRDEMHERR
jgi:hypothetical protein